MKKITLHSVEMQNFVSFKDKQRVDFQSSGVHFIKGENQDMQADTFSDEIKQTNGVGKSTIYLSVDFALFGETSGKKIKTNSLINKETNKNLLVTLDFSVDDTLYRIERYRKLSKRGSGLNLFKDVGGSWADISFSDIKETQEKIIDLISLNHDTFLHSVLITKESGVLFIELPWYQRSQFLENIVRLDKLRDFTKKVKENMSRDRKALDFNEKEHYASNATIKLLSKSLHDSIRVIKNTKKKNAMELFNLKEEIETLLKGSDFSELEKYANFILTKKDLKLEEERYVKQKQKFISHLSRYKKTKNDVITFRKKLESALVPKKETCDTCQKQIERSSSAETIESINHSIEVSLHSLYSFKKPISLEIEELKNMKKVISEKTNIVTTSPKLNLAKDLKGIIVDDIMKGGDGLTHFKEIDKLKEKVAEIENYKYDADAIRSQVVQIRDLRSKRFELTKKINELNSLMEIGAFWDATLDFRNEGSLKNYIMGKIVPVFNNFLGSLIDIIFEGKMKVMFDNSWSETIIFNGYDYDYGLLSLGEKAKLNLCISFALFLLMRINIGGTSVMFLDEIFSSIDASGIEKFISIIRSSFSQDIATYIISHEKGMDGVVPDSIVKVIRKNNESFVI